MLETHRIPKKNNICSSQKYEALKIELVYIPSKVCLESTSYYKK